MPAESLLAGLEAIAQETRLAVMRLLCERGAEGLSAGDIARLLAVAPASLSQHLSVLQTAGLARSDRLGQRIVYRAERKAVEGLMAALGHRLLGKATHDGGDSRAGARGSLRPLSVLVLCTANAARSIMAEALLNDLGRGRLRAYSAGSRPIGSVDADVLALLRDLGFPTEGLRSKSWSAFSGPDAPDIDVVITVCDQAAGEPCPAFIGTPATAHWGVPDPLAGRLARDERRAVIRRSYRQLAERVSALLALDLEAMDRRSLAAELKRIALFDGATETALRLAA